jgi:hypothetical protein
MPDATSHTEEIQRLRSRLPDAPKGSPEAALACFDLWTDEQDHAEALRLLAEVEAERERHLLPMSEKQP